MHNTHATTTHSLSKINHTNLFTLANAHLDNLFKQNGNNEWFMVEFPYKFDKIEKHWQIDDNYIDTKIYSMPMILIICQITYQNLTMATYRLYLDKNGTLIDEFFCL